MWEPHSYLEKNDNRKILKDDFSSWKSLVTLASIAPELIDQSNETSFRDLKSKSQFLPQPKVSRRSYSI